MTDHSSDNAQNKQTIVLAAGGTGGHLFPARSLATDLISRGFKVTLMTDERGMKYSQEWEDLERKQIKSATFKSGLWSKFTGTLKLALGYCEAHKALKKASPLVVIGFGGYPSLPPLVAAQRLKIPTIIHEQNAVMGKANAFLAPKADRIATALPHITGLDEADTIRCVLTGNPVRGDVATLFTHPYPTLGQDDNFRVLLIGGSQGASVFSKILPKALERLPDTQRARISLVQQCRTEEEVKKTQQAYDELGINATLDTFIKDVAGELSKAHLVISRSGASTVAEVTTAGRPAIFVPYPYHADQQQKVNAQSVANAGGAWVMEEKEFTAEALSTKLQTFLAQPETLFRAAEAARSCAKPDAARKLGNLVTALAYGWNKDEQKPYDYTQGRDGRY